RNWSRFLVVSISALTPGSCVIPNYSGQCDGADGADDSAKLRFYRNGATCPNREPTSKVCRPSRRARYCYRRGCSCWLLVRNAIALWRPYHSGRVIHRLRFFSIGDRHYDDGG